MEARSSLLPYILQGIILGFGAAAQPGPFQTYLISQSLLRGPRRTVPAALAPLLSDGPIIAVSLLLLSQVPAWLERALYTAGGIFIVYLSYRAYGSWRRFDPNIAPSVTTTQQSLFNAAFINALNPNPYVYWTLVAGPILLSGWRETPVNGIAFLAGFYLAMILSLVTIIVIFGAARQIGPQVNRILLGASAIVLLAFGLFQLWRGLTAI